MIGKRLSVWRSEYDSNTWRNYGGGQSKRIWEGASLETFSGEGQLKKPPCIRYIQGCTSCGSNLKPKGSFRLIGTFLFLRIFLGFIWYVYHLWMLKSRRWRGGILIAWSRWAGRGDRWLRLAGQTINININVYIDVAITIKINTRFQNQY